METSDLYVVIPRRVLALGPWHLAVYAALVDRANRQDECWPSHSTLAKDSGVSVAKVRKVLAELREAGWIDWQQRSRDDGGQSSNVYRVYGTPRSRKATPHATSKRPPTLRGSDELIPIRTTTHIEETSHLAEARRLAEVMSTILTDLDVKHRITEAWITELDRMMRLDGRTPEQVEGAMRWALADPFWSSNIHSPKALRKQFDRLRLNATRGQSKVSKAMDIAAAYERAGQ